MPDINDDEKPTSRKQAAIEEARLTENAPEAEAEDAGSRKRKTILENRGEGTGGRGGWGDASNKGSKGTGGGWGGFGV